MNLQDKIGREHAKFFLEEYAVVHNWDPEKVLIFKGTNTYRLLANPEKEFTRTKKSALIIYPLELDLLSKTGTIDKEQYDFHMSLLRSTNDGDFVILEASLNLLRNKRLTLSKRK